MSSGLLVAHIVGQHENENSGDECTCATNSRVKDLTAGSRARGSHQDLLVGFHVTLVFQTNLLSFKLQASKIALHRDIYLNTQVDFRVVGSAMQC